MKVDPVDTDVTVAGRQRSRCDAQETWMPQAARAAPPRRRRRPATGSSGQQQACEASISIRTGHSACQDPYEDRPHIM
jgi:hypothetical protein